MGGEYNHEDIEPSNDHENQSAEYQRQRGTSSHAFNRLQFRAILSNTRHFDAHCTTTLYRPLNRRLCSLPLTSRPRTVVSHLVLRRQLYRLGNSRHWRLTPDHEVVEGYEADGAAVAVNYYGAGDLEAHQQTHRVAREHVRGQRQHRL